MFVYFGNFYTKCSIHILFFFKPQILRTGHDWRILSTFFVCSNSFDYSVAAYIRQWTEEVKNHHVSSVRCVALQCVVIIYLCVVLMQIGFLIKACVLNSGLVEGTYTGLSCESGPVRLM